MTSRPPEKQPISYVKLLREIRDGINKEIEHMTFEEARRWREARRKNGIPMHQDLMAVAKPPTPDPPEKAIDNDEANPQPSRPLTIWDLRTLRAYADPTVFLGCVEGKNIAPSIRFFDNVVNGDITLLVSDCVLAALEDAPAEAKAVLERVPDAHMESVVMTNSAKELVDEYVRAGAMSESARSYARHYALATLANADRLTSWDRKNIVNFDQVDSCAAVNIACGHNELRVCTPASLGYPPYPKSADSVSIPKEEGRDVHQVP